MSIKEKIRSLWAAAKPLVAVVLLLVVAGFAGAQWQSRIDGKERATLVGRFPKVRAEAAASATQACEANYAVRIAGLMAENATRKEDQAIIRGMVSDTQGMVADMRTYMGQRAAINDRRNDALQRQARTAALAAVDAKETAQHIDQNVKVAVIKADEAASAVKSVDKKLDTATRGTAAVPPQPWIGNRR